MFANLNFKTKDIINFFLELLVTSLILYAVLLILNGISILVRLFVRSIVRTIGFGPAEANDGLSLRQLVGAALLSILLASALFKWLQHVRSTRSATSVVSPLEILSDTSPTPIPEARGTVEPIVL
ncbi:MAG: hypothetical protein KJ077_00685 [Anaerolineae bacterium]|nr:hypothetical protein [Anaerolineae bacterium]